MLHNDGRTLGWLGKNRLTVGDWIIVEWREKLNNSKGVLKEAEDPQNSLKQKSNEMGLLEIGMIQQVNSKKARGMGEARHFVENQNQNNKR